MLTDAIQMVFMLVACALFMIFGIRNSGADGLIRGMAGATGEYASLFCPEGIEVFFAFGLPTAVGLISGPFGDQSFWQRAFAVKEKHLGRAFFLGALFFGIVPLAMGVLGFIGAGTGYEARDLGIINFELITHLFPGWVTIPFLFMIVSGLLSTVDSNLCAVSSLTTDIAGGTNLKKTKSAMVALLIAGILIANIPGITVTHLFLFYGTLRASTLLPTVLTLKGVKLTPKGIVIGIATALAVGLPIFAYGAISDSSQCKTIGSLTTVFLSGLVAVTISRMEAGNEKCTR